MRTSIALLVGVILITDQPAKGDEKPVVATVESTMVSDLPQIRQLAFDGDPETYFASKTPPKAGDTFTMIFDEPVAVKGLQVVTGKPDGSDKLDAGTLEVSTDGKQFDFMANFIEGLAKTSLAMTLKAIRIKPSGDMDHPLAIREIRMISTPTIATFAYPVEFVVDVQDAPEMKGWADDVARLCERWYGPLNERMKSDGYKPARVINMALKKDYKGVAEASGPRIKGSVAYFTDHPDDKGAMIHETIHVIQRYRGRGNPGWLVEGVADYLRFWVFEPGKAGPVNPRRARYDGSYRTTGAFLAYVTEKYDKEIVAKLNVLMREGKYKESAFQDITGKTVQELGQEWKDSLAK